MICSSGFLQFIVSFVIIVNIDGLASPLTTFTDYPFSIELVANTTDLYWKVDNDTKSITFELHIETTGWIGLGISPVDGMTGADIGVGWIDSSSQLVFQNLHAYGNMQPVMNNGTIDWFGLQGKEEDGWTAIQMRRLINACDSMDYPIKSGTDILIYAWGLTDPDPPESDSVITYHQNNRGSIVLPLQSYSEPSTEDEFAGLDTVEFFVSNYTLPTNQSTYYCQVFKVPDNIPGKRHAIAREIIIDSNNPYIVYDLTLNECDREAVFDDNNLPSGPCDANVTAYNFCGFNIVIGWGTGDDYLIKFPNETGLPIGQNFSIKYYMIQVNYYNPDADAGFTDSSGVRLYIGNEMRPYDLGGLTFGMDSTPEGIAIPPQVNAFFIDSYCTSAASLQNFPSTGITIVSFFGHTHSQGVGLWTKVVRNGTAVDYLFNAESYNPYYQFQHQLLKPITVYPGDEFASRCTYNTMQTNTTTLGGPLPTEEMCVQVFNYYPRMDSLYACVSTLASESWNALINETTHSANISLSDWLLSINWTPDLATQWQSFYDASPRYTAFGRAGFYNVSVLLSLPTYQDINNTQCQSEQNNTATTSTPSETTTTSAPAETTATSLSFTTTITSVPSTSTTTSVPSETTTTSVPSTTSTTSVPSTTGTTSVPSKTTTTSVLSTSTTTSIPSETTTTSVPSETTTTSAPSRTSTTSVPSKTTTISVLSTSITTSIPSETPTTSSPSETSTTSVSAETTTTSVPFETTTTSVPSETTTTSVPSETTTTSVSAKTTTTSAPSKTTTISSTTVNTTTSGKTTVFSTTSVMNTTTGTGNSLAVHKTIFILPSFILCFIYGRIN